MLIDSEGEAVGDSFTVCVCVGGGLCETDTEILELILCKEDSDDDADSDTLDREGVCVSDI